MSLNTKLKSKTENKILDTPKTLAQNENNTAWNLYLNKWLAHSKQKDL